MNEIVKQIILYCRQNGLLSRHDVGQLWDVSLIVFQHSTPQMAYQCGAFAIICTSESHYSYLFT